jgi:hypothetical protein
MSKTKPVCRLPQLCKFFLICAYPARISDHFLQRFDSFRLLQAATRYIDAKSFNGFGGRAATLLRVAREMDRGASEQ